MKKMKEAKLTHHYFASIAWIAFGVYLIFKGEWQDARQCLMLALLNEIISNQLERK